jgi:hypothetical protein
VDVRLSLNRRSIGRIAAVTTAAMLTVALAIPAAAAPLDRGTFHEEFNDIDPDFCGTGLDVRFTGVFEGRFLVTRRGRDGLVYFMQHVHITETLTNLANGKTISDDSRSVDKDLHVVDNGDGTLSILVLATGNFVMFGADGKPIGHNSGQIRSELLIDHGGTPDDPSDDVELDFTMVKESTGTNDDACEVAVPALT